MFEDKTYKDLLATALSMAPEGVDTRQGSIFRDAVSGQMLVLAAFYADLESLLQLIKLDTAPGEYLRDILKGFAVEEKSATLAKYEAVLVGGAPAEGSRFTADDLFFDLFYDESEQPYFECVSVGSAGNGIIEGTAAIPMSTIEGLQSATFGALLEAGADAETDEELRERGKEKIAGPAENGNKQHYKTWCESVDGVSYARIIPKWKGPNTVKGIIFGEDGGPAGADVIARVQEYVDPDNDGDGEGDGLGEGAANLGAKFTAVAPVKLEINVSAKVLLADGGTLETVTDEIREFINDYLNAVAIESEDDTNLPVIRYNEISSAIMNVEGVLDHENLLVNGATANIQTDYESMGVLGALDISIAE